MSGSAVTEPYRMSAHREATRNELNELLAGMSAGSAPVSPQLAEQVAREHYGIEAVAQRLTGERDENFHLRCSDGRMFVLKISNPAEDRSFLDLLTAALLHLESSDSTLPCPHIERDLGGRTQTEIRDDAGHPRSVRLLSWIAGKPLRFAARSAMQRQHCGRLAARLAVALRDFTHPASHRPLIWNLRHLPKMRVLLQQLPDFPRVDLVTDFIEMYEAQVAPQLAGVRHQVVHNDLNDRNILVDDADDNVISGIIDFGDLSHTAVVADLAIMIAEQITAPAATEQTIDELLSAYQSVTPLLDIELAVLRPLIAARIVMSAVIPSWHKMQNPAGTHYARVTPEFVRGRLAIIEALI